MADYWIKWYHEILDDPKMATLPNRLWRRFSELCLLSGRLFDEKNGELPDLKQIAWALRMSTDELKTDMDQLITIGFVQKNKGGYTIVNFEKRQRALTSTERSKQSRSREQRKKYAGEDERVCGVYKIECVQSGKVYIGSSVDCNKRIKTHFYEGSTFETHWMHEDLERFGRDSFISEIVETVNDLDDLPERETFWIEQIAPEKLYNKEHNGKRNPYRYATGLQRNVAQSRAEQNRTETEQKQSRSFDDDYAELTKAYEHNIGALTGMIGQTLEADLKDYGLILCLEAINRAVRNNVQKWSYVQGILKRMKREGYTGKPDKPSERPAGKVTIQLPGGQLSEANL
jgi:group I intron endonuclease